MDGGRRCYCILPFGRKDGAGMLFGELGQRSEAVRYALCRTASRGLSMGERTGSRVFHYLWPYVSYYRWALLFEGETSHWVGGEPASLLVGMFTGFPTPLLLHRGGSISV